MQRLVCVSSSEELHQELVELAEVCAPLLQDIGVCVCVTVKHLFTQALLVSGDSQQTKQVLNILKSSHQNHRNVCIHAS